MSGNSLRNGWRNGLLFGAMLLMSLLAAETILLFLIERTPMPSKTGAWAIIPEQSWIEYHPVLGWWHKKNYAAFLEKNDLRIPVTTNSAGFRGRKEYSVRPAEDVTRICALGDSFTFGFGVTDDETFTAVLEKDRPAFEVLNCGVAGYGVDQIYLAYKELARFQSPDIVLISLFPEDFWRAKRAFNDGGYGKPYFKISQNGRLVLYHVPVPQGKEFRVPQFPGNFEDAGLYGVLQRTRLWTLSRALMAKMLKRLGFEDPDTSDDWILGRAILKELIAEVRSDNARAVLMIVPPIRWITGTDEPVRQSLLRFAKRENAEIIDLTTVFKKAARETDVYQYYIKDDDHWTAEGHRLAARALMADLGLTQNE